MVRTDKEERRGGPRGRELSPHYNVREIGFTDLATLVSNNPGTDVINSSLIQRRFGEGASLFDPMQFDPIRVVWVQVSPTRKELLIEDGHHRASVVHKNQEVIKTKYEDFSPLIRDVTDSYLERRNNYIAQETQLPNDQPLPLVIEASADQYPPALTMEEYLDATAEPTLYHKELVAKRAATHLMKGWSSYAGDDLVKKYTFITAFAFLAHPDFSGASEEKVAEKLRSTTTFFNDDTPKERQNLREALMKAQKTIRRYKVNPAEVSNAAFSLLIDQPQTFGGNERVIKQITGLLYLPEVQKKLRAQFGTGDNYSRGANQLSRQIVDAVTYLTDKPVVIETELGAIHNALINPDFTVPLIQQVLAKPRKEKLPLYNHTYKELLQGIKIEKMQDAYKAYTHSEDLSGIERHFLRNFALGRYGIDPAHIHIHAYKIKDAASAISEAEKVMRRLYQRESLTSDTSDATRAIEKAKGALMHAGAHDILTKKLRLQELLLTIPQENLAETTQKAEPTTVYEAASGTGKSAIVEAVQAEEILGQLRSLTPRRRNAVLNSTKTLPEALEEQRIADESETTDPKGKPNVSEVSENRSLFESLRYLATRVANIPPLEVTPKVIQRLELIKDIIDEKLAEGKKTRRRDD